jgi:hypothetical protein
MVIAALAASFAFGQSETPIARLKTTGPMNAGGNVISNLAPGVASTDAATAGQVNTSNAVLQAAITAEGVLRVAGDAANAADILLRPTYPGTTNIIDFIVASSGGVWRINWQAYANAVSNALAAAVTNEAALRASGDREGTNYTDAVAAGKVSTNDTRYLATMTNGSPHASLSGIEGAGTLHVTAADTNLIKTAWQNPASASYWTWTSDGTNATMTSYSGPSDVVIPDKVDNLFVTGVGNIFYDTDITSIIGGKYITVLESGYQWAFQSCNALTNVSLESVVVIQPDAFYECSSLASVSFPSAVTVGAGAFNGTPSLSSAALSMVSTVGRGAFDGGTALTSVSLPNATTINLQAFRGCTALTSVYFGQNAPAEAEDVYLNTPNVTNYVTNPTATGWGATWGGRPVVRLPLYTDELRVRGTNLQTLLDGKLNTNATSARIDTLTATGIKAITSGGGTLQNSGGETCLTWGAGGQTVSTADGLMVHGVITGNGSGITNMTAAQVGAVSNTPAGIAAGGGLVTNSIPGPGCTYLGTSQAVTLTGATTSYRAEPAGVYTVSVAQAASRYTYALEIVSTNPCTLAAGLNLQGSWTITGTNILAIVPCTGTLWRVYGRGI